MEATYWLVGVKFNYKKTCFGKTTVEQDERTWTVWAKNSFDADSTADFEWDSRRPKTAISGTEKFLKPRKLTSQEIKKMESVFKKG